MLSSPNDPNAIWEFRGKNRWISNFHECAIAYEGMVYPSTEHAYMAAKSLDQNVRLYIATLKTPAEAKKFGMTLELRPNWDDMRLAVMLEVNRYKYQNHPELAEMLLATGDAHLEEGNSWGDRFWGVSPVGSFQGENNLGKILMQIRSELRQERDAKVLPGL